MKELLEFAQLSVWSPEDGDQRRLYEMALAGVTKEEAKSVFEISESHFNLLYKRLKDRMTKGVLENPMKELTRVQRMQFDVRRQYETAMILIQSERKAAGIPLARAAMKKAEKLGLFQVALDLCRELMRYYSTVNVDKGRYEQYFSKLWLYLRELQNEINAELIFFEFAFRLKKGKHTGDLEEQFVQLSKTPSSSFRFHYMRLLGEVISHQVAGREDEMLEACHEALEFFKDYDELPYVVRYSFSQRAIPVHIARGEYQKAEDIVNMSLDYPAYGHHNWQIIMYYRSLLGFYCGKPKMALDAYTRAIKIPKKHRTNDMEERWQSVRAYLELFELDTLGKWSFKKFQNNVEESENENIGFRGRALVVELLHLLKNGEHEQYRQKASKLDILIKNHFSGKGQERGGNYLRLFQIIEQCGFDAEQANKKASGILTEFKNGRPQLSNEQELLEVVPCDKVWEMAMDFLR